jgi:hypothetical protein
MRIAENFRLIFCCLSILFMFNMLMGELLPGLSSWQQPAGAAPAAAVTPLPAEKTISLKDLEKYKAVSVSVSEEGKEVKYSGVPMRVILGEMIPEMKMESMDDLHAVNRKELVLEVLGSDGYPALVTAAELAYNKSGDRFLLATHKDGKLIEEGAHLICKMDDGHFRWVKRVTKLRGLSLKAK